MSRHKVKATEVRGGDTIVGTDGDLFTVLESQMSGTARLGAVRITVKDSDGLVETVNVRHEDEVTIHTSSLYCPINYNGQTRSWFESCEEWDGAARLHNDGRCANGLPSDGPRGVSDSTNVCTYERITLRGPGYQGTYPVHVGRAVWQAPYFALIYYITSAGTEVAL